MHTKTEIAEILGLMTPNGRPHTKLVGALLRHIKAQPAYIEGDRQIYGPCVLPILREVYGQAVQYELPKQVNIGGRVFNVRYWPEEDGAADSSVA
jgi:hypothetical protein